MQAHRHISCIVAVSSNGVIGHDNDLPWSLPDDLQYFKEKTLGHAIIMGRKTYESIGRPLPKRTNIIISRDSSLEISGCIVTNSVEKALQHVQEDTEPFIIGGGLIFELALPLATRLYITEIHAEIEGNIRFPHFSRDDWREVSRIHHVQDEEHIYSFDFVLYERKEMK